VLHSQHESDAGSNHFFVRRVVCFLFSHTRTDASIGSVGIKLCERCLRVTGQKTVRARVTRGDIARRFIAAMPPGWSFHYVNWRKNMAHVTVLNGKAVFAPLAL
jgi:hypothetical protein